MDSHELSSPSASTELRSPADKMSGQNTCFFYGTLMAPEVFYSVLYGVRIPPKAIRDLHTFTPAILNDHCRHRIRYRDYPAVVPETGYTVRGVYATGLTDDHILKLDRFEGSEYMRVATKVDLMHKVEGREVVREIKDTTVYIFLRHKELDRRSWDFDDFRINKMPMWTRGGLGFGDESRNNSFRND
ncbi:Protein AIG2 [Tolypocladium capitatum]|uniref:Putative gamma-glutamylcyclotransferase n=1 Tax=Tolypocladium capitatum TaxID=45235 RepID=A0A2K3QD83_9HYPO|nr:Protein AIG2 [Tolypocladium capitatum]